MNYGFSDFECNCLVCRGARSWEVYEATGIEPDWQAVRAWRARSRWLATANVTIRRGLSGPRRKPEDA